MNISKSLMALLLAATLAISAGFSTSTYAAEIQVGADTITVADDDGDEVDESEENIPAQDIEIASVSDNEIAPASEDGIVDEGATRPEISTEDETDKASTIPEAYRAAYDAAIASIAPLNKAEALWAAINDTMNNIPKFKDMLTVEAGIYQVKGYFVPSTIEINPITAWITSSEDNEKPAFEQLINALANVNGTIDTTKQAELQKKTFEELIALGKSDSRYTVATQSDEIDTQAASDNAEFTKLVDDCQKLYNAGLANLRKMLPVVGASPTAIQTMNGEALASLATTVPEYKKYGFFAADDLDSIKLSEHEWELFYNYNEAVVAWKNAQNQNANEETVNNAYGRLVAIAKSIDPEFAVNLSNVARLVPTAPETGSLLDGESSATVAALALGSIVAVIALIGVSITIKRFYFSPLKRRRY